MAEKKGFNMVSMQTFDPCAEADEQIDVIKSTGVNIVVMVAWRVDTVNLWHSVKTRGMDVSPFVWVGKLHYSFFYCLRLWNKNDSLKQLVLTFVV